MAAKKGKNWSQVHARRIQVGVTLITNSKLKFVNSQEAKKRQEEGREVHWSPGLLALNLRGPLNCFAQGTDVGKSETFDYSGKLAASREAAGKQASPEPQVPFLTV